MELVEQSVTLLSHTPNPEELIEKAGRVCYKSESKTLTPETSSKFIRGILRRGHESVIEHASATMLFVCDRGMSHEIVRHRIASFSQESTRFCNYKKKGVAVVCGVEPNAEQEERFLQDTVCSTTDYLNAIESGARPEFARRVLPIGLKTEIVMTANFREWRHFLGLRMHAAAHPQMRWLASETHRLLMGISPTCFDVFYNSDALGPFSREMMLPHDPTEEQVTIDRTVLANRPHCQTGTHGCICIVCQDERSRLNGEGDGS